MLQNKKHKANVDSALRNSEDNYYRSLFVLSRDAIMTLEAPSWRFTSANPATLEMFRAKNEEEFLSYEPWELSPKLQPDGRASDEKAKAMIEKAMREGSNFFDWVHKRLNGEVFFAEVLLSKVGLGGKMFLHAVVRDVTERKRVEESLREKMHDMEVLLDAAMDREEKMMELKERIKALEARSGEKA